MSNYTEHCQDDENNQVEADKDNQNNAVIGTNVQKMEPHDFNAVEKEIENLMIHNQLQKEDVVACDSRASYMSQQPSYHLDMHADKESQIHLNPPLCVYFRKRWKKITVDGVAPPLPPQISTNISTKQSGKVGKMKNSASSSRKREEKICIVKENKAGNMVLRQTISRINRNKAYTKEKCRDNSSKSTYRIEKNKCKLKRDLVRDRKATIRKGMELKRSVTSCKAIQKLLHRKHTAIQSILSGMKASEAVEQESEDETSEGCDENLATSSRKPKRKKHRPKVQNDEPKAAPRMAQNVRKSTEGKVKVQKTGENPLKKRGRPKGSKNKDRRNEGKFTKHVSKRRKVSSYKNFRVLTGFYVPRDSSQHVCPAAEASSLEDCHPTAVDKNGQIVLYDQSQGLILFKVPKHFKKVHAKVPIGAENERLWPLLALGGIPSDFEDHEYWKKERELMKKKVTNFILKMHEVQGDRRFSPWKGSVLDSVVGAFLTQNVLDHLSSSAFMSIASRFPPTHKEYGIGASEVETETKAESCLNDTQMGSTTDDLVHMSCLHKSSALCKESPNKNEDHEEGTEDTSAQNDVKKVRRRLFKNDQVTNKRPMITKQEFAWKKPSEVSAINSSTSIGATPLSATKTHKTELEPMTTPSIALKILKKRRLSHISGIERAHIEENLNGRKRDNSQDWESIRKLALNNPSRTDQRLPIHEDSVDWEAVRSSSVEDIAKAIKDRGMHHVLSGRIKAFLKALKEEHGNTDLEWLRKLSPEDARAYLMSIHGLNVKSTECIRLLTLHHVAFPVDVHVGRVCVRLGWVPIKPLPEQLQLHLLELYPLQKTVQKYLWPRLCTLDQKTLYEFHYQLITFGKVFCTKSKPNCLACPMRNDCKHFASAYASAKILLIGLEEEECVDPLHHPSFEDKSSLIDFSEGDYGIDNSFYNEGDLFMKGHLSSINTTTIHEDEEKYEEEVMDLEDFPYSYKDQIDFAEVLPRISFCGLCTSMDEHTYCDCTKFNDLGSQLICPPPCRFNGEGTSHRSLNERTKAYCDHRLHHLHSNETSTSPQNIIAKEEITKAIISCSARKLEQTPQLKRMSPLRTIHHVYEIPDMHPLLEKVEPRRKDDPSPYLLVLRRPGEISQSKKEIENQCHHHSSSHDDQDETILGTLLIPCRSAMQGSFPLNGTYFQVNEVFADHESSIDPLVVSRALIWQLQRRFVYFGYSVTQIFRGLTRDEIKECFSNGYICVRGFDRRNRTPKPLLHILHSCKGKEQRKTNTKVEN